MTICPTCGQATPDPREMQESTALEIAAKLGHADCMRLLLEGGADPNLTGNPWRYAIWSRNIDCVKILLKGGADLNARFGYNQTPLMEAVNKWEGDCIKILLEAGADINLQDTDGFTALMKAVRWPGCVKMLLNFGADIDLKDNNDWTALVHATDCGSITSVEILLKAGANPNVHPYAIINYASLSGYGLSVLLEAGADPNLQNRRGWTALMEAARWGKAVCMKMLLEAGADETLRDNEGNTALSSAIKGYPELSINSNAECVRILREWSNIPHS